MCVYNEFNQYLENMVRRKINSLRSLPSQNYNCKQLKERNGAKEDKFTTLRFVL